LESGLLLKMSHEDKYIIPLKSFKHRTLLSVTRTDQVVPYTTSSINEFNPYEKFEKCKGSFKCDIVGFSGFDKNYIENFDILNNLKQLNNDLYYNENLYKIEGNKELKEENKEIKEKEKVIKEVKIEEKKELKEEKKEIKEENKKDEDKEKEIKEIKEIKEENKEIIEEKEKVIKEEILEKEKKEIKEVKEEKKEIKEIKEVKEEKKIKKIYQKGVKNEKNDYYRDFDKTLEYNNEMLKNLQKINWRRVDFDFKIPYLYGFLHGHTILIDYEP
jgi:flagellar biosynthesis GTPase FlhF